MRQNVILLDRVFRFGLAGFLFYWGSLGFNMWTMMALYLLATSAVGHCAMYRFSERNHTLKTERYYLDQLPKNNPEPIIVFCPRGTILFQNDASKAILPGIKSFFDVFQEDPKQIINKELSISSTYIEENKTYQFEAKGVEENNHILTYGFNITDIIQSKEDLRLASITDELTGLGNRRQLNQIIDTSSNTLALITLDLVKFGEFNAFYGHHMGNTLLQCFADFLIEYEKDFDEACDLFRLQGNTFAILIHCEEGVICNEELPSRVHTLINTIRRHTFSIDDINVVMDARAGVAINTELDEKKDDAESLMGRAEATLQETKTRDLQYLFYRDIQGLRERYSENLYWSNKLKAMFIQQQDTAKLTAFYQPIFNFKTNRIEKYEALARIQEGEDIIPPFKFLDAAKQLHLLSNLTKEMINQSFKTIQGLTLECSINFTAQDLGDTSLLAYLEEACSAYAIAPSQVVIEILEDEDIYDFIETIHTLKTKGFKIAVDDFGVGYSNFKKLQQLDADYIKIDGSLVKNITTNPQDLDIIKSIVTYAKTIGAKTIAEFVSSEEIFDALKAIDVDYAQGYHIAAPSPKLQEKATV